MAVNVPQAPAYLAQLGAHIVALRSAINNLVQDATYLNAMGGAAFLQAAPLSIPQADAAFIAGLIGAVTPANSTVQDINAFITTAVSLTGGQTG